MWRWAAEEGYVRLGFGGIHTVTITHIHYTNRGVILPCQSVSTSCWTLAVSPSSENQSMLCSMSYYPRLLPTHLLIMDPYSPKIAHKIYKCDNKTNNGRTFSSTTSVGRGADIMIKRKQYKVVESLLVFLSIKFSVYLRQFLIQDTGCKYLIEPGQ